MKAFFPMRRGEAATLAFLIAFAAFAFIPIWRTVELWGMAVFGWLIAALMVISPAIALATFLLGGAVRRRGGDPARGREASGGTGPGAAPGPDGGARSDTGGGAS